jgi:hypothetical protein
MQNVELRAEAPEERPAVVCEDVEDLEICALRTSGALRSSEPVVDLRNCRNVFLHGNRAPAKTGSFLRVAGAASAEISIVANDLSRAAAPVVFADGASSAMLASH